MITSSQGRGRELSPLFVLACISRRLIHSFHSLMTNNNADERARSAERRRISNRNDKILGVGAVLAPFTGGLSLIPGVIAFLSEKRD